MVETRSTTKRTATQDAGDCLERPFKRNRTAKPRAPGKSRSALKEKAARDNMVQTRSATKRKAAEDKKNRLKKPIKRNKKPESSPPPPPNGPRFRALPFDIRVIIYKHLVKRREPQAFSARRYRSTNNVDREWRKDLTTARLLSPFKADHLAVLKAYLSENSFLAVHLGEVTDYFKEHMEQPWSLDPHKSIRHLTVGLGDVSNGSAMADLIRLGRNRPHLSTLALEVDCTLWLSEHRSDGLDGELTRLKASFGRDLQIHVMDHRPVQLAVVFDSKHNYWKPETDRGRISNDWSFIWTLSESEQKRWRQFNPLTDRERRYAGMTVCYFENISAACSCGSP